MFSASRTICSKGVPTLKQLRHFGCWARKCSSTIASSRSALLFLTPSNFNGSQPYFLVKGIRFLENVEEREIGIEKLGQSKERTEMPPLILNGGRSEQELFGSVPDAIGYFLACFLP
jgi:hypothetical protein